MRKAKLTPEELTRISGGDMGDGKYGGDGGYDDYFQFNCRICGSDHFFIIDMVPKKVYTDGSYRPANGLFRCMDCNTQVWQNL